MTQPGDNRDATVNLDANVTSYVSGMSQAEASTNRTASAVDRLDQKLQSLSKRASKSLVHFSEADFAVLSGATADAATFEKQLGTLNATAKVTGTSFAGVKGAVESAFTKFPVSRTQVVQLTEAISNLGVSGAQSIGSLVQTFIKLGAATGEGPTELAQGLVQLSRLFGTSNAQQIGNYANSLLTVSKNSGVSATGVLSFSQSIAPMARQAGIGEAAVLGISAAFTKAGADGYVAANVFNSIVSSITSDIQSGSPDLAKYANLIGVTVAQFKTMSGQDQFTQIFDAIAKQGPAAINTLNRLGIDGTRAQSAIAAVVQSGGLQQAIAQATGSAGNQNNLNKGSKAAMADLADDLAMLRNQFTQFGTEVGTTFLKPLEVGIRLLTKLGSVANAALKPFAPLVAVLGAVAVGVAAVGGGALSVAGLVGAGALVRTIAKSGPLRAGREGMLAGRGTVGLTTEESLSRNASAVLYASGRMPMRARIPYVAGRALGETLPPYDPEAPRSSMGRQIVRGAIRGPFIAGTALVNSQREFLSNAGKNDYARSPYRSEEGERVGFRASVAGAAAANRASVENEGALRATTRGAIDLTRAFVQLGVQTGKTGAALITNGRIGGAAMAGESTAGRLGAVRNTAGSLLGGIAGTARGLAGSIGPVGAAFIGVPLLAGLVSRANAQSNAAYDLGGGNTGIQAYDHQLGISATNLANFSSAVSKAKDSLATGTGTAQTLGQAARITSPDIASATGGYKVANTHFQTLAKTGNTNAAVAYIQTLGVEQGGMSPTLLSSIKSDLINTYGSQKAGTILQAYLATNPQATGASPNINYGALGKSVNNASTGRFKGITSEAISGISSQSQVNPGTQSSQALLAQILQYGYGGLQGTDYAGDTPDNVKSFQAALAQLFGGKGTDYGIGPGPVLGAGPSGGEVKKSYASPDQFNKMVISAIQRTSGGKNFLQGAGISNADVQTYLKTGGGPLAAALGQSSPGVSTSRSALASSGPLGSFASTNQSITNAVNAPESPAAQYQGMTTLLTEAQKAGGGLAGTTAALDKLQGIIGATSDPLFQLADAAKQAAANQQSQFVTPYQNRTAQLSSAAGTYTEAFQANQDHPTQGGDGVNSSYQNLQSAQANYATTLQAQTQYELSAYQSAQQFGTQMQRAQQDENRQISISQRDFYKQQLYAQQDYQKQIERAEADYATQMSRQAQSSAQSIYDPYTRVQAKLTADAGTLLQNLQDQNSRISDQFTQLQQLSNMGVSQQSIDTLSLSDPNNAQQVNNLVTSLTQNPQLVQQINSAVASRLAATTQLTQSTFSMTYRNTAADFSLQIDRGAQDYATAQGRAVDAQTTAMNDMATAYNIMVQRSGQDLTTSMTELYGNFADNYGKTLAEINTQIGQYAPGIAATLTAEITAMNAAINGVVLTTGGTISPKGVAGTTAQNNAIYSAPTAPAPAPVVQNQSRPVPHAMGGISTIAHTASISEGNRPEAIIPLDGRGVQFLTGMYQAVSMAVLKSMQAKQFGGTPTGSAPATATTVKVDNSTQFSGPVSVQASDPNAMAKALQEKARIKKLTTPSRSTAAANLS